MPEKKGLLGLGVESPPCPIFPSRRTRISELRLSIPIARNCVLGPAAPWQESGDSAATLSIVSPVHHRQHDCSLNARPRSYSSHKRRRPLAPTQPAASDRRLGLHPEHAGSRRISHRR